MDHITISTIRADLKAKRDALSLCHEELKKDSDDWNKAVIVLSLLNGMIETVKITLSLGSNGFKLIPIFLSSLIAIISSLIKFRDFPNRMEILIQSISMITETLNKYRNHEIVDRELLRDYNNSLEKLEMSLYPDIRKKYLLMSHKNLIAINKLEKKYFYNLQLVEINSSNSSCGSDDSPQINTTFIHQINDNDNEVEI